MRPPWRIVNEHRYIRRSRPAGRPTTVAAPSRGRSRTRILLGSIAVLALVCGGIYAQRWYAVGRFIESTNNAYLRADQVAMAPRVSGQVSDVYVHDNQEVAAGQPLLKIDARRYEMMVRQAEATVAAREADVAKSEADLRQQDAVIAAGAGGPADRAGQCRPCGTGIRAVGGSRRPRLCDPAEERADRKRARAGTIRRQPEAGRARGGAPAGRHAEGAVGPGQGAARRGAGKPEPGRDRPQGHGAAQPDRRPRRRPHGPARPVRAAGHAAADRRADRPDLPGGQLQGNADRNMRPGQPAEITVDAYPDLPLPGTVESFAPGTGAQFALLPPENATGNFTKIVQRVPVRIRVDVPAAWLRRPSCPACPSRYRWTPRPAAVRSAELSMSRPTDAPRLRQGRLNPPPSSTGSPWSPARSAP